MPRFRAIVESLLPWYRPELEEKRDARTERIVQRSEAARLRVQPIIDEYRRAEAFATSAGTRTAAAVTEFRDAQEGAREAGERLIEEVESTGDEQ